MNRDYQFRLPRLEMVRNLRKRLREPRFLESILIKRNNEFFVRIEERVWTLAEYNKLSKNADFRQNFANFETFQSQLLQYLRLLRGLTEEEQKYWVED